MINMKIKVTFKNEEEAYLQDDSTESCFDWEYRDRRRDATNFESLSSACYFLSKVLDSIPDSFFNSDNEISKIEFV